MDAPDIGIKGFQKKDFVEADKVLGPDVRLEQVPDGVKFYIKGKSVDLGQKRITVNLYELISVEGGLKVRRDPLEKFVNRIPEDDEIALKYGPNDVSKGSEGYMWIAKWRDLSGEEKGILSDTIFISEKWRARYEDAQRKGKAVAESPSPSAPYAPAPAVPGAFGPMEVLALIEKGEERAVKMMERMTAILQAGKSEAPASVMERAYEVAGRVVEKSMESNLRMSNKVTAKAEKELERVEEEEDGEDGQVEASPGGDGLPSWLAPFLPKIEQWLGSLLGGGPVGAAVKTVIVSSDEWKTIFADKEKFGQAVEAMRSHFGEEQTQKAMDILLNVRNTKKKK